MIDELVLEYLSLSDKMRNGYIDSLGTANQTWKETLAKITSTIPKFIYEIYGKFSGTYRAIQNQKYMDFIPGYRLIHIEELEGEYHSFLNMLELDDVCEAQIEVIIPILADYSSCYICYSQLRNNEEVIFHYSPDDGLQRMHHSIEQFLKTIIAFYKNGVFYLDKDGFLDYHFEKEGIIGAKYNPDIAYWIE